MTEKPPHKSRLKSTVAIVAIAAQLVWQIGPAAAFCGFYVAQADSKLFNKSSKVVLARNGTETAITMASDYEGEPREFALVIPVPTFIERKQIGVVETKTIDHLDSYTAPRLVEYYDEDPCRSVQPMSIAATAPRTAAVQMKMENRLPYRGVTVEANYDVGEYDISILSAQESDGLASWLTDNGYKIPNGAEAVLASYIKQKMRFFVAKVNLDRMKVLGNAFLRPLQVRYESAKFMLPLRLGTVNAKGPQDLIIYALSRNGRVETTNYRTIKVPSGMDVPLYVKDDFGRFYQATFDQAVRQEDMRAVFAEYAWDMGWCDPCSSPPLASNELIELGARWIAGNDRAGAFGGANAFVTRLHVRYDTAHFPEDLALIETRDRENFQARYVLRHPCSGNAMCVRGAQYQVELQGRFKQEARTLSSLTGWALPEIESSMALAGESIWWKSK